MYTEHSNFYVVDVNYDVVFRFTGFIPLLTGIKSSFRSGFVGETFKNKYTEWEYPNWTWSKARVQYIVFDSRDHIVSVACLRQGLEDNEIPKEAFRWHRNKGIINWEYRKDPVPYTGHSRTWKYYRNPRFVQELRSSQDHGEFSRTKRMHKLGVINIWDETMRADRHDKYSWKKNKKRKQWM